MIRKPVIHLALVTLSLTSVVLALSGLTEGSLNYWYLYFSPLMLAAYFYGVRGSLITALVTFGSFLLLYRHALTDYQAVLAAAQHIDVLSTGSAGVAAFDHLAGDFPSGMVGTGLLVCGALLVGWLIDKQHQQEDHIQTLQSQDALTGLPTRQHFIQTLRRWDQESSGSKSALGLIVFDVDSFGALQQRYGHFSGDLILERIGQLLAPFKSKGFAIARLGSDEFGLAYLGASAEELQKTAEAVQSALREYDWRGMRDEELRVPERLTASFGVAMKPQDGETPGELMRVAWSALETQRAAGGDGIRFASSFPELDAEAIQTQELRPLSLNQWREIVAQLGPLASLD